MSEQQQAQGGRRGHAIVFCSSVYAFVFFHLYNVISYIVSVVLRTHTGPPPYMDFCKSPTEYFFSALFQTGLFFFFTHMYSVHEYSVHRYRYAYFMIRFRTKKHGC